MCIPYLVSPALIKTTLTHLYILVFFKVSRQKQALTDELLTARKELERNQAAYDRIVKEKEILMTDKGELVVQVTATERENRMQSESVASLTSEKDQLEAALYEAQQSVQMLEVRKSQLEGENQELIVRKENLQGQGHRTCADNIRKKLGWL